MLNCKSEVVEVLNNLLVFFETSFNNFMFGFKYLTCKFRFKIRSKCWTVDL